MWAIARQKVSSRFGLAATPNGCPLWIEVYGWLSIAWTASVLLGATVFLASQFAGAGILLSAWLVITTVTALARTVYRQWIVRRQNGIGQRLLGRQLWRRVALANSIAVCILLVSVIPLSTSQSTPAVIEYAAPERVRASVDGFVREVFVQHGDYVEAGTPILRLSNPELDSQVEQLDFEIQTSQVRETMLLKDGALAERRPTSHRRGIGGRRRACRSGCTGRAAVLDIGAACGTSASTRSTGRPASLELPICTFWE